MKTNPNEPITPSTFITDEPGLTKREYFAAMAMQGFCANSYYAEKINVNHMQTNLELGVVSGMAIQYADALIKALNETPASQEGEKG